ncbi:MAG: hypothetical protein GY723_00635 [bacterium]|nr:hypothetical protein [bacterium]MCP5069502.1 hypothetical protein [bacterium]
MRRLGLAVAVAGLLALPLVAFANQNEGDTANPCNPCAENPCAENPCAENPCEEENPCNPCEPSEGD